MPARDVRSAVREGNPFVVRRHPLVQRVAASTTLSNLAERLAGRTIEVAHKHRWIAGVRQVDAGKYLSKVAGSDAYWRHFLLRDFGLTFALPMPAGRQRLYFDYGWIGPAGTVQTFHQDNHDDVFVNHNVFAQVVGRKYVAVAAPSDSAIFRRRPLVPGDCRHSKASPRDASVRGSCVTLGETILEPGDLLYIPPRHWHYVESRSTSISISRWWFDARIAELLYASVVGIDLPRRPRGAEHLWENDLEEIGGAPVLRAVLRKNPVLTQFQLLSALVKFYGKGVVDGGA
jgi:hypothetical protein